MGLGLGLGMVPMRTLEHLHECLPESSYLAAVPYLLEKSWAQVLALMWEQTHAQVRSFSKLQYCCLYRAMTSTYLQYK